MKIIFKYMSILTIALIAFSCEFDENGRMPNDMEDACFPYIEFDAETSSPFINLSTPEGYVLNGTINILFEDVAFDKLKLVVAYNGGYDMPYVLEDNIKSFPYEISVTSEDLVSAVAELASISDFAEGDVLHVYVIPTIGGTEYPPYQILGGKTFNTISSSIYQNLGAIKGINNADVVINVPCELTPASLPGTYYMASDDWGAYGNVTIEADPENPYKVYIYGIAEAEGLVDLGNGLPITIDPVTYKATAERTTLAADLAPWGLSYVDYFYNPVSVTYNTCDGSFSLLTYIGVSIGGWGNFNYKFTPVVEE